MAISSIQQAAFCFPRASFCFPRSEGQQTRPTVKLTLEDLALNYKG